MIFNTFDSIAKLPNNWIAGGTVNGFTVSPTVDSSSVTILGLNYKVYR